MAMTNIVINDGASTPISHTFTPQQGQQNSDTYATWYEKLSAFSVQGWNMIRTRVQLSTSAKKAHVMQLQLRQPKVSVVDGIEVPQGEIAGFVTVTVPYGLNTDANMATFFGLLKNGLAHAEATGVFVTQKPSA